MRENEHIAIQLHGTFKHKMTHMHSNVSLVMRNQFITTRNSSCGKVMLSQVCVCSRGAGREVRWGGWVLTSRSHVQRVSTHSLGIPTPPPGHSPPLGYPPHLDISTPRHTHPPMGYPPGPIP